MSRAQRPGAATSLRPHAIGVAMLVVLAAVVYFAFRPSVPFVDGYRVDAVFTSSNGLRENSPVRVAGVDVGKVVEISEGPGRTTVVTMELSERGRPVGRDATARIRPRVFLEGGFMVELRPGTPGAPELPDEGTIPLAQTAVPVQMHQALTVFDAPARENMRRTLDELAGGFAGGGAEGLRRLAGELEPLLRDLAWTGQAMQGEQEHDVSRLVAAMRRVTASLDDPPERLGELVDHLAVTARAVRSRDAELSATLREAHAMLREAPQGMASLDGALGALERAAVRLAPALPDAPRHLRATTSVVRELGRLVHPSRRATTLTALETAFRDLPGLVGELAVTFPTTKPMTDCLRSHIVPLLKSEVPDGEHSTGRPVWQDFAHALVGLASASQNFDGNGHSLRYQVGAGDQALSTTDVGELGTLFATAPSTLRSRPLPRADRKPPPVNAGEPCSEQPRPRLETPSGPAGLRAVRP
jgi:virulence factor Mce-like protein